MYPVFYETMFTFFNEYVIEQIIFIEFKTLAQPSSDE